MSLVYKSSCGKSVPLSFTGKHLMQNLREAITNAQSKFMQELARDVNGNHVLPRFEWQRISEARLAIVEHMSKLEKNTGFSDEHGYGYSSRGYGQSLPTVESKHWSEALRLARDPEFIAEARRRGFYMSDRRLLRYESPLSFIKSSDLTAEVDRRGLMKVAPTVQVHGDITKVSTDDLLKEIKRRTQLPPGEHTVNITVAEPAVSERVRFVAKTIDKFLKLNPNVVRFEELGRKAKKAPKRRKKLSARRKK